MYFKYISVFLFSIGKASVKAFQSAILLSGRDYYFSKINNINLTILI